MKLLVFICVFALSLFMEIHQIQSSSEKDDAIQQTSEMEIEGGTPSEKMFSKSEEAQGELSEPLSYKIYRLLNEFKSKKESILDNGNKEIWESKLQAEAKRDEELKKLFVERDNALREDSAGFISISNTAGGTVEFTVSCKNDKLGSIFMESYILKTGDRETIRLYAGDSNIKLTLFYANYYRYTESFGSVVQKCYEVGRNGPKKRRNYYAITCYEQNCPAEV